MKEGNVPCTNTASDPMHSPSAEFTSQRRMGSLGKQKKHPPADADVRWTVEGGWGGKGETHAEQKMKIWFLLSLGLLSLSAGDQERSGGGCLAESAVDVRRDLFQRRQ